MQERRVQIMITKYQNPINTTTAKQSYQYFIAANTCYNFLFRLNKVTLWIVASRGRYKVSICNHQIKIIANLHLNFYKDKNHPTIQSYL